VNSPHVCVCVYICVGCKNLLTEFVSTMDFCVGEGAEREIEKGCKVANARCSPRRDHLAPLFFSMFCKRFSYKINCPCFRRCGRNEQRFTSTSMVEFAVLGLQNPAGAQSPDAFLR
jgi:hypothetical protein